MQSFYSNLVKVSGETGEAAAATVPCAIVAVSDSPSFQQALARLTQVSLAELTAVQQEMGWHSWWKAD